MQNDADDFMEDDDGGGDSDSEDDHSVASATTTMSTSSVGSNTPSLVSKLNQDSMVRDPELQWSALFYGFSYLSQFPEPCLL